MVMSLPSPKVVGTSDPGDKWPETVIIKNNKHDITWQGGGGGTVCLALTLALPAFLWPVNREASRVEDCTYKRRATPKGKEPSPGRVDEFNQRPLPTLLSHYVPQDGLI